MREKKGKEWGPNVPRHVSPHEVAWTGGFALLIHGESHSGPFASDGGARQNDYDPNYNINSQEELAEPGSKGVE